MEDMNIIIYNIMCRGALSESIYDLWLQALYMRAKNAVDCMSCTRLRGPLLLTSHLTH